MTINVEGDDDLPTVVASSESFVEDTKPDGVLLTLNTSDAEDGTPLNLIISSLPTKGKLYISSDGTLTGNRTEIAEVYNVFRVGTVIDQYVDQ
eukprot:6889518-Prymnesium_polylepis.1